MKYSVYILKCADGTLYTGSTNDIDKRLQAHNESPRGARYTKARRPVSLAYTESFLGKTAKGKALKREFAIKQLTRLEKLELVTKREK
jgi:putative endonuclease